MIIPHKRWSWPCARSSGRRAAPGLLACLLYGWLTVHATPALAHTRLLETTPLEGQPLSEVSVVTLRYSEPIQVRFSAFTLHFLGEVREGTAAPANRLTGGAIVPDDARRLIEIRLPGPLVEGWYALHWAVLADDGHRIDGILRFRVQR